MKELDKEKEGCDQHKLTMMVSLVPFIVFTFTFFFFVLLLSSLTVTGTVSTVSFPF
jgi:hypothetical protein